MAYSVPIEQPLSESQAKFIAQIGTMKNISDLPFFKKFKLKKEEEISLFDYLIKVLRAMGIDPQILISAFLIEFFKTEKLIEFFFMTIAKLAAAKHECLDENYQLSFSLFDCSPESCNLTDDQIIELVEANYAWLNSQTYIKEPLKKVLDALKTKIIEELMIIMFGRPKGDSVVGVNGIVTNEGRMNELIEESICGGEQIFSVSVPAGNSFGDLEYNRLQKLEQINKGVLSFKITCQGVDISLPDNPMYLFTDVAIGSQVGQTVSPQEAIENVINYVGSQIKKQSGGQSSQSNATTAEKTFSQKLLETLISSITTLVSPFLVGYIGAIPIDAQYIGADALHFLSEGLLNAVFPNSVSTNPTTGKRDGEYVPATSCEIVNSFNKESMTGEQKKKVALMTIMCNLLLNMAISFILSYVIEKAKNMIKKYIINRAQAKMERKVEKMKKKFETSALGSSLKKSDKAVRQVRLMQNMIKILKPLKNSSVPSF